MSWFTLSNGEKLYYEDKGQGPDTIIMMHGWTSTHDIYLKPVETLQEQARCIIYDHRGHGKSKNANSGNPTMETLASDLHEIIQGLSLSNVTLLGWSMGAGVVLNYRSSSMMKSGSWDSIRANIQKKTWSGMPVRISLPCIKTSRSEPSRS